MAGIQDAGRLRVDPDALQNAATQITAIYNAMVQVDQTIVGATSAMVATGGSALWSGSASQTFASRISETSQALHIMLNKLQAAGASIPAVVNTVQNGDNRASALFVNDQ